MTIGSKVAGEWNEDGGWPLVEDSELLARARKDSEAFSQLYRAHVGAVSDYVYRRTGDSHVTQDLVADVFMRALHALPRFESRGIPLKHWLLRIATNRIHTWSMRRKWFVSLDRAEEPSTEVVPTPATETSDDLARRALRALPDRYQAVLSLHYVEGLSVLEVARVLRCREGTIKSRLARGRELLRRVLLELRKQDEEHT